VIHGSFAPRVRLIVWRDARHRGIEVEMPQRYMGATLDTYPSRATRRRIFRK